MEGASPKAQAETGGEGGEGVHGRQSTEAAPFPYGQGIEGLMERPDLSRVGEEYKEVRF